MNKKFIQANIEKPPTLEDFELDYSVYSIFQLENERLEQLKEKKENAIKKIENNPIIIFLGLCYFLGIYFLFLYLVFDHLLYAGYLILTVIITSFLFEKTHLSIYSILTFGKYKREGAERENIVSKIEELTENTKNKVKDFEISFSDYYKHQLDNFYFTRLYKKRSGTPSFEESLGEFNAMIEILSDADKYFITQNYYLYLREYKDYLSKRAIDHQIQAQEVTNYSFRQADSLFKNISEAKKENELPPPEKRFHNPTKIDWEKISKERRNTGLIGEEFAISIERAYLTDIGRADLADRVTQMSKENDSCGFDILSFYPDGSERYIEVKSTKQSENTPFYISSNELNFLREHIENYYIFRLLIDDQAKKNSAYHYISVPEFLETKEITPIQFMVKNKIE